jgi:hypothetical protein
MAVRIATMATAIINSTKVTPADRSEADCL